MNGTTNRNFPFLIAFVILFALFYGVGLLTKSFDWTWSRILICLATVGGVNIVWSLLKKVSLVQSFRSTGFGAPDWHVVAIAFALSALMLVFFPLYSALTNLTFSLQSDWLWILLGIITGVGIAEESLFRGFVFNYLRGKHAFWKAATLSMLLFGAMHLLLLLWLPIPVAVAAIILSIVASYPMAFLFETSNRTIWAPAILHTTALATNLFEIPTELSVLINLLWIGVIVIGLFLAFGVTWFVVRKDIKVASIERRLHV
ncbi:MAG: hypothetical protein MHPDNHAH_00084 [Anaerolineales bacterium]|nr:hypothetical protein [Anaerolineales bacterium]WKZ47055.1 MAG: CPBP family intramembrane metalloprotease [Anaerolineales bacterium]